MIHCSTLIAIVLLFGKDRALAEQRASPLSDFLRRGHRRASQGHRLVDMVSSHKERSFKNAIIPVHVSSFATVCISEVVDGIRCLLIA